MAVLLDTHIMIWMEEEPQRIPPFATNRIESELLLHFSMVSVWEMAIKMTTGKLSLPSSLSNFIENFRHGYKTLYLPISFSHIYRTQQLPFHHRDPFDRLLIAQCLEENMPVVSADETWDRYGITRIRNS